MSEWAPVRPFQGFPDINPSSFDPRSAVFIPDGAVNDAKLAKGVSPTKLSLLGIKAYRSTNQSITTSTNTLITYDSIDFRQGFANPGATFTAISVPYAGIYLIVAMVEWAANTTGQRTASITLTGGSIVEASNLWPGTAVAARQEAVAVRRLVKGDTIGVTVSQSSGGNLNVDAGSDNDSLSVVYLGAI